MHSITKGPIHHWHHEVTWNVEPKSQEGPFLQGMMLTLMTSYEKTPAFINAICQLFALPLDIDVAATLEFSDCDGPACDKDRKE